MASRTLVQNWNIRGKDTTRPAIRSANRGLGTIGDTARRTTFSLGALTGQLGLVVLGYRAMRHTIDTTNTVQNINNRLNLVVADSLEKTKEQLFDISRLSFASFEASAQFFSKLALSAKELGRDTGELIKVVEIANKAVAISGSTAEASANGLIQFSQGIASNRLAGDELRSVLEGLPALADAVARGLGATRGELRALAADGKLTGDAVVGALLSQEDEVNEYFKNFNATVSLAFQQLENQSIRFFDKIEKRTGVLGGISDTVIGLADSVGEMTDELVEFTDRADGLEDTIRRWRVELELVQAASVAYLTYLGSAAVANTFTFLINSFRALGVAATAAWAAYFAVAVGVAGWYAIAETTRVWGDYLLEGAEKANVMQRSLEN